MKGLTFSKTLILSLIHISLAAKNRTDPMVSEVGFYTDQQRQRIIREQQVLDEIEGAMDRGEIIIYIQAKYDIVAQRVIGGEALVRWQHTVRGLLGPGQFVGVLEENGLIMQLDYYVSVSYTHLSTL